MAPRSPALRRSSKSCQDLAVQLDVFEEQRENDEAQSQHPGVDLNSPLDVFYAILNRVADTPQEIPFLSILQHLLRIDPKEAVSDVVWDTAERLVHRATLLECREDATRLLRSPSQKQLPTLRKPSLTPAPAPPPPPPAAPPPPPTAPPPPVAPPPAPARLTPEPQAQQPALKLLPQQETPTPKTKMKTINWNKIPNNKVVGKHNIWSMVARNHQGSPMADLDWSEMEGLFCQQAPTPAPASPRPSRDHSDTKRNQPTEIALLDGKRSLNVNIFLKQFRSSNEDIIQLIRNGEHDDIGAEKLRGLLKILPELDELEMLRNFDGDKTKLGNAEKFLLQLIEVPNYKLRIESMLLKEEFAANMSYLEPSINAMIVAGEDLMRNESLREVLYMVVVAGNFLNAGGYAGNAAGVKLSSLQKLTDIRANKPGMNLIHFVALQAEKKKKELLRFPDDMSIIEEATKTTVEQLQHEINALDARIKVIHKQIDLPTTEKEIKDQMADFLKMADQEVTGLQKDMEELESVRKSLAEFFCEDPGTFKVEECFKIFHGFCSKFKQAVVENDRRRQQEEQAAARRRQREEHLAKRRTLGQQSGNGSESEGNIVDSLLSDIRSGFQQKPTDPSKLVLQVKKVGSAMTSEEDISVMGSPALSRRRLGSFSCDQPPNREETYSPDVTPTGSLRRRRSRVPSEEDESTLMDFLRASGHDGSRERKSWGSLDRSWARRARGGGRKRPDLLSADFYGERERPTSPLPTTPDEENKPKPWKQKIEAWLSENEKEDKQNEEIRRRPRRFQPNRRSLEADSESEGRSPLDTLPEGKLADGNLQYKRVYSDWRPTIEKTDVVGAMEAIAEATPDSPVKDKSPWRKSNLNVPNTSEQTELDVRRLRRLKSRSALDSPSTSPPLQAINEEEKRKEVIRTLGESLAEVTLPVYMRRPSDQGERFKASPLPARKVEEEETNLPPFAPRRNRKLDVPDKVEIDSDNIETPPATRRVIPVQPPRCSRLKDEEVREEDEEEEGQLGEGRFDRFAASRRTLRYRKPVEEETPKQPELVPEKQVIKQETRQAQSTPVEKLSPKDKESRLKKWQDKLKSRFEQDPEEEAIADITKSGEELRKLGTSSTLPRPTRRNTSVDPKEVLEAIGKQLKETTAEVEPPKTVAKKPNEPVNKIVSSSTLPRTFRRRTNIDQSDVTKAIRRFGSGRETEKPAQAQKTNVKSNTSASHSSGQVQETSKPSNVKNEFIPEIKVQVNAPAKTRNEHELNDEGFEETQSLVSETPSQGASSGNYEGDSTDSPVKSKGGKLLRADSSGSGDTSSGVNTREVKRTSSMRAPGDKKSVIPRRSASMRKSDSQSTLIRQASDKRVPHSKTENTPAQRRILALANKQNSKPAVLKSDSNIILTPKATGVVKSALPKRFGSRSSLRSSGSSLNSGASVSTVRTTVPKRVAGTSVGRARPVSTSFKENTATTSSSGESIGPTKKGLHFMRPTAASAAKDTLDSTRLRATLRSIK